MIITFLLVLIGIVIAFFSICLLICAYYTPTTYDETMRDLNREVRKAIDDGVVSLRQENRRMEERARRRADAAERKDV